VFGADFPPHASLSSDDSGVRNDWVVGVESTPSDIDSIVDTIDIVEASVQIGLIEVGKNDLIGTSRQESLVCSISPPLHCIIRLER